METDIYKKLWWERMIKKLGSEEAVRKWLTEKGSKGGKAQVSKGPNKQSVRK